ncbi:hypothetical protein L6164_032767 [Bauhinia variegata]|nr:hypothetical protein L6164_032767 [Bauhinia variegata]
MMKLLHDATERYLRQQSMASPGVGDSSGIQSQGIGDELREDKLSNGVALGNNNNNNHNADEDHAQSLQLNV